MTSNFGNNWNIDIEGKKVFWGFRTPLSQETKENHNELAVLIFSFGIICGHVRQSQKIL